MALCTLLSLVTGACLLGSIAAQTGSGMPTGVPGTTYRWESDPWGQCSRTCDGVQIRLVYCEGTQPDSSKIVVNDAICDTADPRFKPFDSRPCGVECPDPTFSWSTGPYGDCSSVCGPGTRSREVVCQKQEDSTASITTDNECLSNGLAPKPDTTESCVSPCEYTATNWTECSSSCNGNQTRTILCTKTLSSGAQQTVDISYCDDNPFLGVRPNDSQPCNVGDYRWATGPYSSCSETCGGTQTRRVYCTCRFTDGTSAGEFAEPLCFENDIRLKPIHNRSCGIECETYSWSIGEWGVCSALCGQGVERRTVTCQRSTQLSSATVADSECTSRGLGRKPPESRDCQEVCRCVPSSWSSCSVRCGCGQQTRTFSCVQSTSGVDVVVEFRHCENDPTLDCQTQEQRQCEEPCYEWDPQVWGACSTLCGPGTEERDVPCMREGCDGVTRANDNDCVGSKPDTTRQCDPECRYNVTEWSSCSETCGAGFQERTVFCLKILSSGGTEIIANDNCDSDTTITGPRPPPDSQDCFGPICPIPPKIRDPPTSIAPNFEPPKSDVSYFIGQRAFVIEGYSVSIDCTEIQADPLADMVFQLPDGTRLGPDNATTRVNDDGSSTEFRVQRYGPRNITLIIDNAHRNSEGNYRCIAQNSIDDTIIGTDTKDSSLTVYTPPVITNNRTKVDEIDVIPDPGPVPTITVAEDDIVEFACEAAVGNPPPDVKWYVGDQEILTGGRYVIGRDHSLTIRNILAMDAREYRCEAINFVGEDQSFVSLRVEALQQAWQLIPGPCSHTCGPLGTLVIGPQCIRLSDNMRVADNLCTGQKPTARREVCNRESCPARWATRPYGPCSSSCIGEQFREVFCRQELADGRIMTVSDDICVAQDLRLRPQSSRSCGVECRTYKWREFEYGECSSLCGEGEQFRDVVCIVEIQDREERAREQFCIENLLLKPPTSRACNPVNQCFYNLTDWTTCSTSCGAGIRTRTVTCIKRVPGGDEIVPLEECAKDLSLAQPISQVDCFSECPCVLPIWQVGEWSPCPASCGSATATQKRDVICRCFDSSPARAIADAECHQDDKPAISQVCGRNDCPCVDHYWRKGPYDPCVPPCEDGLGIIGTKERKVDCICFKDGVRQQDDPNQCDQTTKPVTTAPCFPPPCECLAPQWVMGDYGSCSKTCKGIQTRSVYCTCNNNTVDDGYCLKILGGPKPDEQTPCGGECPCINHYYKESAWTSCSQTCGEGVQTRRVACYCEREHVYELVEDRQECENAIGEPFPASNRACSIAICPCRNLTYIPGPWTSCMPNECYGSQTRSLSCYCDDVLIDIRNCDAKFLRRPSESRQCGHCPFIWQPRPWAECDANCHRRRAVLCKNAETGETFPKRYCYAHSTMARPDRTERCEYEGNKTKITWEVTAWTPCSKPCMIDAKDRVVKRRTVTCVNQCLRVKAKGCNPRAKPRHVMRCNYFQCDTTQCKDAKGWDCSFALRNNLCNEPEWNYRCCATCATGQ